MVLHHYLVEAARRRPHQVAVREPGGASITFGELDRLSDRLRDRLVRLGVRPGERVGFWIGKSIDAVATIFGALKAGAAYVPVDPSAPAPRNAYILRDCAVTIVVLEKRFEAALVAEFGQEYARGRLFALEGSGGGTPLHAALDAADRRDAAPPAPPAADDPDRLAYILYTSGSTGKPKGVMLTHRNAASFVEWCASCFLPGPQDCFSSHAPFHFDLSILDIYCAAKSAAQLVLIPDELGKNPAALAEFIAESGITVWYSAPSILSLLAQFGKLGTRAYASLRLVLFAGEVFPISHLKSLARQWPHARYFNLYGPTETNVCTFYEVPLPIDESRTEPMPIGRVCSHLEGVVVDEDGRRAPPAAAGELCIRGPGVTQGYWNLPEQSAKCFLEAGPGARYYRTGDLVRQDADGELRYLGRRDRMIKKRGYRIELGEIESCLYRHPNVREAAVTALPDDQLGMKVTAHLSLKEGDRLSLIELKRFCSERIPVYMIPDVFAFHPALPKTSTDKVDYQTLKVMG